MRASDAQAGCGELAAFHDFFQFRGVYYTVFDFVERAGSGDISAEGLHVRVFALAKQPMDWLACTSSAFFMAM